MTKVLLKRYLNASKEDNFDLEAEFGHASLLYTNYEVEVLIELDTETGDTKVIGCDGRFLDDQEYTDEEFYEMKGERNES